jgi:hypothetical protein
MKFVLVGSYLAAAGFEVPKFTAEYRNNIHWYPEITIKNNG